MIDALVLAAGLARIAHEGPARLLRSAQEARRAHLAVAEATYDVRTGDRPADRPPGGILAAGAPSGTTLLVDESLPPPLPNAPPSAGPGPQYLKYYTFSVFLGTAKTGTSYFEKFQAYAPLAASGPRPLLVAFHRWGVSHLDIDYNTPLFDLAWQRGWYIIAPLSASGVHVNSLQGQQNTEMAIDWMLANFDVDPERIYGLGFSMGGGMTMNFAARHLDPKRFMFAALVDHTGSVSQNDTYAKEYAKLNHGATYVWDYWFGLPLDPFQMLRTSVIDFDPNTLVVDPDTDMAGNLTHVPLLVSRASTEAPGTAYLTTQCDVLVSHMTSLGQVPYYEIVPYMGHSWNSLDFVKAVQFLSLWKLRLPENADTLADQDGRFYYFYVHQDAPGAFTPFSWSINDTQNKVLIWHSKNLKQVDVDVPLTGLATDQVFWVVLKPDDGLADDVLLAGWPSAPSKVERDGSPVPIGPGPLTYTYDPVEQELFLDEDAAGQHQWFVYP